MFNIIIPRIPRGLPTFILRHNGTHKRSANNFTAHATASFNRLPPELRCPIMSDNKFKVEVKRYVRANWLLPQHYNEVHDKNRKRTPGD